MSSKASALTAAQLRDVQDVLRKPLSGRHVLIPFGSKAFVAGELDPSSSPQHPQQPEEMIQLRQTNGETGELISVTRRDAVDRIQQEIAALRPKKTKPTATAPDTSKDKKRPTLSHTQASKETTVPPNFFEIREELNDEGQEVHAEAVDITQHLKLWESQVKGGATTTTGTVTPTPPTELTPSISTNDQIDTEPEPKQKVSDEDFAALAARLDELARLEEEEEAKQTASRKSARKLQSKGWAKGFLNNNTNKKKQTKPSAMAPTEIPAKVDSTPSRLAATKPESTDHPTHGTNKQSNTKVGSVTRVGFSDSDQVHEIPRIGQRSVNEIQKPSALPKSAAISQVVRERPRKNRHAADAKSSGSESSGNTNPSQQERKLSRFAQQRLGQS